MHRDDNRINNTLFETFKPQLTAIALVGAVGTVIDSVAPPGVVDTLAAVTSELVAAASGGRWNNINVHL